MINDLIQIFKNSENIEKTVLDNYTPKDGTYFRINKDKTIEKIRIKRNETEKSTLYDWFKKADYYSILIDMNKPIDTTKKIHSNNYYTMFIKCDILPEIGENTEKRLTKEQLDETINNYFKSFLKEQKDKKAIKIMEVIDLEEIQEEKIQENCELIKEKIPEIIKHIEENNLSDKNYIKIFIEKDLAQYKTESKRYLYPRIFNKNDFNIEINGEILGLANNNMGLNTKKPYLELKSTNFRVPYRITLEEALVSKQFFEWLGNLKNEEEKPINTLYIPIDFEFKNTNVGEKNLEGETCLYIYKTSNNGKPVIEDFDIIRRKKKIKTMKIKNYLNLQKYEEASIEELSILENKINNYYYNGRLKSSYYNNDIKAKEKIFNDAQVNILITTKQTMLNYFRKGNILGFATCLDKMTKNMIFQKFIDKDYVNLEEIGTAQNFRLNLLKYYEVGGKKEMGDRIRDLHEKLQEKIETNEMVYCETNEEFYFAAGQIIYYLATQSEAQNRTHALVTPFLDFSTSKKLKEAIITMFKKYGYKIRMGNNRVNNLVGMIMGYETESKVSDYQDLIISGICSKNVIFTGKKEEE